MLEKENSDWLESFQKIHGRAPKILHIGNIANNAYNNAKLLNEVGLDCDVICYDYYHIMGCPEWEDADFEGEIKDDFFPDWSSIDLNGFKRPKWFAQGPARFCIKYLIARRNNNKAGALLWWKILELNRWFICSPTGVFLRKKVIILRDYIKSLRYNFPLGTTVFFTILTVLSACIVLALIVGILPYLIVGIFRKNKYNEVYDFDKRISKLMSEFADKFPDREDQLTKEDFEPYRSIIPLWKELFSKYDIIEAYSTDPIYPLLTGKKPYIAYEHGTIRDIPFENSSIGRLTLLSYALADVIYITNADSVNQAKLIIKDNNKLQFGLHGFDNRRIEKKIYHLNPLSTESGRFGISENVKLFFCPARHHWLNGFPTWLKGNNLIIEAVKLLETRFEDQFIIVFVDWGQEVELSKNLIKELKIDKFFRWIKPLGKYDLLNTYRCADCVIDQFVLPCIGGISIEALTIGMAPVITYLDNDLMTSFFNETIPCFNCKSSIEIARAMETVITKDCKEIVVACKQWMNLHHSYTNVINSNLEAYKKTKEF